MDSSVVFVDPAGRSKRPADVVTIVFGVLLAVLTGLRLTDVGPFEQEVIDLLDSLPSWTDTLLAWAFGLGALYGIALTIAAIVAGRRYLPLVRDIALAVIAVLIVDTVVQRVFADEWPRFVPELAEEVLPQHLALRPATVTAILLVAGPYLTRPFRRFGTFVIVLVALGAVGFGAALPSHALGAIGLGMAVAGFIHAVLGTPDGYPDHEAVVASLRQLGLRADDLVPDAHQSWGVRRFDAVTDEGTRLRIKLYGRDARDTQFWSRLWRWLWYRDSGPVLAATRLQQVEHEALMLYVAADHDVSVASVVTAAKADAGDAVLALRWDGEPATDNPLRDHDLTALWSNVRRLYEAEISHGGLNLDSVRLGPDGPVISGFDSGSVAAPESRRRADIAELLFSTATSVGPQRAVAAAVAGLGPELLLSAGSYLQEPAIGGDTLKQARKPKDLLAELRTEVAEQAGGDVPQPVQLRRVSGRNVVMGALLLLAGYVLISMLADLDWEVILAELQDANWGWVVVAFAVAQVVLLPEAISMMAAVEREVPLRPSIMVMSAAKFLGLAVPGPTGRIAMTVAYLRKFGVPGPQALAQGGVDSIAGLLTEATILVIALVLSDVSLDITFGGDTNWALIVGVIIGLIVAGIVLVALVPALRNKIMTPIRQSWDGFSVVLRDPGRLVWLFGANFGARMVNATVLWLVLQAFGVRIPLITCLVVTVAAALLAGLIPVPGGVGVAEATLAAGLVAAGLEDNLAFAAAVTYRLVVFYLPPVIGVWALKWLERHGYV